MTTTHPGSKHTDDCGCPRTPRRSVAVAAMKAHGVEIRNWLQRDRSEPAAPESWGASSDGPGHGVTRAMREIKRPAPTFVHRHSHTAGKERRHIVDSNGKRSMRGQRYGRRADKSARPGAGHVILREGKSVVGIEPKPPNGIRRFKRQPLAGPNTPYVKPSRDESGDDQ